MQCIIKNTPGFKISAPYKGFFFLRKLAPSISQIQHISPESEIFFILKTGFGDNKTVMCY